MTETASSGVSSECVGFAVVGGEDVLLTPEMSRPSLLVCMHTWLSFKDDKHSTSEAEARQLHPLATQNAEWENIPCM